ncbi:WD40 repeat protein [Actinoplanes lutulentus]|uniref:WD domain G-beta repeat uncharacterized protein n=1 Tax=Actinoplanes lutulentus TaxID=1287878 RepID=A0A327ZJI3_9ACTN|nr:hypothetical protein [Actinoplanes lutulentus]MBB2940817.1 WD40 repeat protein [Actinoplanes lutulentus]RAK43127.1 WD domain G-beta repeat uncharacterized protein [Actinoplanes lutulentus]
MSIASAVACLAEALAGDAPIIGLVGPPGSGRTDLARRIRTQTRATTSTTSRVEWMTLPVPVAAPESLPWLDSPAAAQLNREMTRLLTAAGEDLAAVDTADPEQAAGLLNGRHRRGLIVVDEIRSREEVRLLRGHGWAAGGQHRRYVMITADASLLPGDAAVVTLEPFGRTESVALMLELGAYGLDAPTAAHLAARAGDRPLACRLAARIFERAYRSHHNRTSAAVQVPSGGPDPIGDAVAALSALLPPVARDRLHMLGVFPADQDIPLDIVRRLWNVSRGAAHYTCAGLAAADLIGYHPQTATFRLHAAIQPHLGAPHQRLLAVLDPGEASDLPWHLAAAGRAEELNRLVMDASWVSRRLAEGGRPALASDLAIAWAAGGEDPAVVAQARTLRAGPRVRNPGAVMRRLRVSAPGGIGALIARPQGLWVASVSEPLSSHGDVTLWDVREGRRLHAVELDSINDLAIAPDSSWLAHPHYGRSTTAVLLDLRTGLPRVEAPGDFFATTPDGAWLAVAELPGELRLYDTATGSRRWAVTAHHAPITALISTPDGRWLATAAEDGTVRLSDVRSGRRRRSFPVPGTTLLAAAPDRTGLVASGPHGHYLLDPETGGVRWIGADELLDEPEPDSVAPDGTWRAVLDGDVLIMDLTTPHG